MGTVAEMRKSEILQMIQDFVSVAEISRQTGTSQAAISKMLDREGIPRPKRPNACARNKELVLQMAREMVSLKEIARRIGTNDRRVRQYLDRQGIVREYSMANKGNQNPGWKGGRTIHTKGYVRLWMPSHPCCNKARYVWEHRLVMEQMIGRTLLPKEVVHHINGVKGDNRPENLQLFAENGLHLAHDLKGKTPKWSPEGEARIQKGVNQWRESRHKHNLLKSKLDGAALR